LGFDANNENFISYTTPNCPNIYLLVILRPTSFGLIEQLRGGKPLKPKRTLRLQPGFSPPRSPRPVYFQKRVEGRFSAASRASPAGIEPFWRVAPLFLPNYSRLPPLRKKGNPKRYPLARLASPSPFPRSHRAPVALRRLCSPSAEEAPSSSHLARSATSSPPCVATRPPAPA
jgi:hypothetical protein